MKKSLIFSLFLLSLSVTVHAATTDFVADGDVVVDGVTGSNVTADMTILSGSSAESWTYTSGVFVVTNPDATAGFKITSAEGASIRAVDSNSRQVACVDNITPDVSRVVLPTTSNSYTVYASDAVCTVAAATPTASGSISGGRVVVSVKTPTSDCLAGQLFSTTTGKACSLGGGANTTLSIFTKALKFGMIDAEVKLLQQYLNAHNFPIAMTGVGSTGKETTYFGPATKAALIKFQTAHNISPAIGFFGPITKTFVNSH